MSLGDQGHAQQFTQLFVAHLTGVTYLNGTWYYTWTEQSFDPSTGAYQDAASPRTGSGTTEPVLVELNNQLVSVPTYAWVRFKGIIGGIQTYEFQSSYVPGESSSGSSGCTSYEIVTYVACENGSLVATTKYINIPNSLGITVTDTPAC